MARILVIEDDQLLRSVLRIALGKNGHAVIEAGNGREGLSAFIAQPADLVVTDLIMPEMEGMETIRALRKLSPTLPIIAITGGGRGTPDRYLDIARQLGASRVVAKPFELVDLCTGINQLLGIDPAPALNA